MRIKGLCRRVLSRSEPARLKPFPRRLGMSGPVSVIVPVLNEELNIRAALAGLQWADEIWVVDSHSNDRTAEIAGECGAKLVQFDYSGYGPKKLNWALEHLPLRNRWVFLLAGDERVPQDLEREIC